MYDYNSEYFVHPLEYFNFVDYVFHGPILGYLYVDEVLGIFLDLLLSNKLYIRVTRMSLVWM